MLRGPVRSRGLPVRGWTIPIVFRVAADRLRSIPRIVRPAIRRPSPCHVRPSLLGSADYPRMGDHAAPTAHRWSHTGLHAVSILRLPGRWWRTRFPRTLLLMEYRNERRRFTALRR